MPKVDLADPIYHDDEAAREYLESLLGQMVQFAPAVASPETGSPNSKARARADGVIREQISAAAD